MKNNEERAKTFLSELKENPKESPKQENSTKLKGSYK